MAEAFKEALKAADRKECPVGAVLTCQGKIITQAGNREIELFDPTAHAEMLVLREAGKILKKHTFPDCTLYTTLWPCPMCENAIIQAKIPKVIIGARSFDYIYKTTFNTLKLKKFGPIMENKCKNIFVKWAKETGREFIVKE